MASSPKIMVVLSLLLLALAVVIIANYRTFAHIEGIVVDQLKERQEIETDHATTLISQHIHSVEMELTTLSKFPTIGEKGLEIEDVAALDSLRDETSALLMADAEGTLWQSSSPAYDSWVGLNIMSKDYFSVPLRTRQRYVAGLLKQGTTSFIIVAAPVFETPAPSPYPDVEGEFQGMLLAVINLEDIDRLYLHPLTDEGSRHILLANPETGETSLASAALPPYPELAAQLPKKMVISDIIPNVNGFGETIVTSSDIWIGGNRWVLLVLAPLANYDQEARSLQRGHLFGLALATFALGSTILVILSLYRSRERILSKLGRATLTLEKLGITASPEDTDAYAPTDIVLKARNLYLVKDEGENNAHELFIGTLNRGFAGLGIVREDPRKLKERYNLKRTPFIWLSKTPVEGIPSVSDVAALMSLVRQFVAKGERSVILVDRLDYLISENGFKRVLDAVHELKEFTTRHECIAILSVGPELIEPGQMKALEAEAIDLFGRKPSAELADQELDMLRLINEGNVTNRLVSFTHLTQRFSITKPTTRKRVARFQQLGLVQVEQRGRTKSLKITSAGRRMLE